jgi:serine-type D-Ala-D-Ala carboxypeptidase/endopeptidase (penicillin-binding protein 4)
LGSLAGCAPLLPAVARPAATPDALGAALDAIFADPAFSHAHWGVLVRSLDSGETLYAYNAERLFLPASNVKLLTGAAALETVGPDYRYATQFSVAGTIRDGTLTGPLVVTGTGDPTLSARFFPDSRQAFRIWADSLRAHGIRRIAGPLVGVDTAFVDPSLGAGWAWDDLAAGYSAEFGALQFNEGVIRLEIFPSRNVLEPAVVVLDPPTQYVRVVNQTRTMPPGSITALSITREEAGPGIVVRGEIAADAEGEQRTVAIRDPTLYFLSVLRETLREEGITVEGPPVHFAELSGMDPALQQAIHLFTYRSPSMGEILVPMMKVSQNGIAETMLRTVGREAGGRGSAAAGAAVVDSLLVSWGLEARRLRMADGSGLSRYNLAPPDLFVGLLARMSVSEHRELWESSLPLAGRDGTLAGRMQDPPLRENVAAKTGTLTGARALSGYLTTRRGERIVFSTVVNSHVLTAAEADRVVEAALESIADAL